MIRSTAQRLGNLFPKDVENTLLRTYESILCDLRSGASANRVFLGLNSRGGAVRFYRNSITKQRSILSDFKSETLFTRFFKRLCSSKPKSGFEKFYPKSKGNAPKAEKPAESKGADSSNGSNKGDGKQPYQIEINGNFLLTAGLGCWAVYYLFNVFAATGAQGPKEITFQDFKARLLSKGIVKRLEVANNSIVKVYVRGDDAIGESEALRYFFAIGSVDSFERKIDAAQRELGIPPADLIPVKYVHEVSLMHAFFELLPTLLLIGATYWLISRQMRQAGGFGGINKINRGKNSSGGGFFNMMQAKVSTWDKGTKEKLSFKDVAGCDEAKAEIMEFVDFLKNPNKYKDLGATIPKGALLVGPPGTGKTLLAKATAGEADVPFLSISGSDFMEMFVGVGPARVRDLFSQARSQAPSIIFIDEIDAIGRARGKGNFAGGHDERENTLNQLLVEMDGFNTTAGVVVLAGTNRPDVLDRALLRPGRFDRTISVDTPDVKGREAILKVHLAKIKLIDHAEDFAVRLAACTPGFSGADLANVCNEAALIAARKNATRVDMSHFESAIDRVIGGLEKKNRVVSTEERRTVAFHESGHAVVSWFLEHAEPLLKVSIVPRGTSALGFAQYLPNENLLLTKEQLLDRVCAILGGRAAEQVLLGKISTGATNDLEKVTAMAYSQVAVYGMNEAVGLLSYPLDKEAFNKPYSEDTARMIDSEVRKFVDSAYQYTIQMVEKHRALITTMAEALLSKEVLNIDDVEGILGKRPFTSSVLRNIDRYRGHGVSAPSEEGEKEKEEGQKPSEAEPEKESTPPTERRIEPGVPVAS